MKTAVALAALVVLGSFGTSVLVAQEGPRPNVVAMSEWKCPIGNLGEAVQLSNATSRPIHQEMIDEGLIVGWNILTHLYADEWNLIFVTLAEDIDSAIESGREFQRRLQQRPEGERGERFVELCPYHRDNIYSISHGDAGTDM